MPKSRFDNQYLKKKQRKLCYEFRISIRCIKTAFYRPNYQKFLMCPLIKKLGWAFVSKHATESLKRSAELLKHAAELLRVEEKTKSLADSLKSSTECLYYNTAHAVPVSHGALGALTNGLRMHLDHAYFLKQEKH